MPDLNDQLRRYIDHLEQPVSVNETMTRPEHRRFRVTAAVLAGAAIVLVPALVLIGLRFLPAGDDVSRSTLPPGTTTTVIPEGIVTTTTSFQTATTDVPGSVVVPDVIGLSVAEAQDALDSVGLEWSVRNNYVDETNAGTIVAQEPFPGATVAPGTLVWIETPMTPGCLDYGDIDRTDPPDGEMQVTVLFECANYDDFPGRWEQAPRNVPVSSDTIEATLREVLAGPTEFERSLGFGSFFSMESASALNTVSLDGSRLTVDFNDAIIVNNASTSTGGMFFMAELQANLFQFAGVDSIEFQLNGSCDAFWGIMEGACTIVSRSDWERRIAAWNAERNLQDQAAVTVPGGDAPGVLVSTWQGLFYGGDGSLTKIMEPVPGSEHLDGAAVLSDRDGGFFLAIDGVTTWYKAGGGTTVLPVEDGLDPQNTSRLVWVDSGGVTLLLHLGYTEDDFYGFRWPTLEPWREGVSASLANGYTLGSANRTVALVDDTGTVITIDHFSDPDATTYLAAWEGPDDGSSQPQLMKVSGPHSGEVSLHDFDGRRVIVSTHPGEPVGNNATFFVIDLECPECLEAYVTQPGVATLTGSKPIEGTIELGPADIGGCSLATSGAPPIEATTAGAAESTRILLLSDAERCGTRELHARAVSDGTELVLSHQRYDGIVGAEALGIPAVEELYYVLQTAPGSYEDETGTVVFVWPALAGPDVDWRDMTTQEAASLQDRYAETTEWLNTLAPDTDLITESLAAGNYVGWSVQIEENGAWRFFGRPLN